MLKVLTLQQCGSKLSVALSVPGVYSNLGLVPCIGLPLPITWGSDCCQMVSLCINCSGDSCVLRGGRINKKNLIVYLLYEPLEILHHFCSGHFLSGSKVFEVLMEALKSPHMFGSPFSASFSLSAFRLICCSQHLLGARYSLESWLGTPFSSTLSVTVESVISHHLGAWESLC